MSRHDRVNKGVTRVIERRATTTGKQMNLRLTNLDEDALSILVDRVQAEIPHRVISRSRILRAIGYLYEDKAITKKIAKSVVDNT